MSAEFIDFLFVDPDLGPDEGGRGATPQNQRWKRCRGKDEGRWWCCECKVFVNSTTEPTPTLSCPCQILRDQFYPCGEPTVVDVIAEPTGSYVVSSRAQIFEMGGELTPWSPPEPEPEPELPEGRLIKFEEDS